MTDRCICFLLRAVLFLIVDYAMSISTFNVVPVEKPSAPCINEQGLTFQCGTGYITEQSFYTSSSIIIAPPQATQVVLSFIEFNYSSTIEVYTCFDLSCKTSSRIGTFTLTVKTVPILRNVTSTNGIMRVLMYNAPGIEGTGSFRAKWTMAGIRMFAFTMSDTRKASFLAPYDKEYHCVLFDGKSPLYTVGTYGGSGYFEGKAYADAEGSSQAVIAWFDSTQVGTTSGGAALRYAVDFTRIDGNRQGGGQSGELDSFGVWAAIDGYEVAPTADDIQRHCLLVSSNGQSFAEILGFYSPRVLPAVAARDRLPALSPALFQGEDNPFGSSIRLCSAGSAGIAGAYTYAYQLGDHTVNLTADDTEYGILGADTLPFSGSAGRGIVGSWAAVPDLGAGTFLYMLQPQGADAFQLTGRYCVSSTDSVTQCFDEALSYVGTVACCPSWLGKDISVAPARGGDLITVSGAGLNRMTRDATYLCQFGAGDEAVVSDPAYSFVASNNILICRTPEWPEPAGRVAFRVVAAAGLAPLPYNGNNTAEDQVFTFTECILSAEDISKVVFGAYGGVVVITEGPAAGGTDLLLVGYGFDPASPGAYRCAVAAEAVCSIQAAGGSNSSGRCILYGGITLLSETTLFCSTPAWGALLADSWAPLAQSSGLAPHSPGSVIVLHGSDAIPVCPAERITAPGMAAEACAGGRCPGLGQYPFAFFAEWYPADTLAEGCSVMGGCYVRIAGFGFDTLSLYICKFWNPAWPKPLLSLPVAPTNATWLSCRAPSSPFPANRSFLSIHIISNTSETWYANYSNRITIADSDSAEPAVYTFSPALFSVTPSLSSAFGGSRLHVIGRGFSPTGIYECLFSRGGIQVSTSATALNDTLLECKTPAWPGPASEVALFVQSEGLTAPISFRFSAAWNGSEQGSLALEGPSSGGDNLRIAGAGFDPAVQYSCEFQGLNSSVVSRAFFVNYAELMCSTPAWGTSYAAQAVTVIVTQNANSSALPAPSPGTGSLPCLTNSCALIYTFTPFAECASGNCGGGCAIGGTSVMMIGFGLDSAKMYVCVFYGSSIGSVNATAQAVVLNSTALSCNAPPWPMQAGLVAVSVGQLNADALLSWSMYAGRFSYSSCWVGKSISTGSSRGGAVITVFGGGFFRTDALYTCEFYESVDSPVTAGAAVLDSTALTCTVPAWPFTLGTFGFGIAIYGLAVPYQGATPSGIQFDFTEGWIGLLTSSQGSAAGGVPLSILAYGLNVTSTYSCLFSAPYAASIQMEETAEIINPTLMICITPNWGSINQAEIVSLGIESDRGYFLFRDGSESLDGALGQQQYQFYQVWNSGRSIPTFLSAAGGTITVQGSGFRKHTDYCCSLVIDAQGAPDAAILRITTLTSAFTTTSLICPFSNFSLGRFEPVDAYLNIMYGNCTLGTLVTDANPFPSPITVLSRGVTALSPSEGFGTGLAVVTAHGFGFDASLAYQCVFQQQPNSTELLGSATVESGKLVLCKVPAISSAASVVAFQMRSQRFASGPFEIIPSFNSSCLHTEFSNPSLCVTSLWFQYLPVITGVSSRYADRLGVTFRGTVQEITVMGRGFNKLYDYRCRFGIDLGYAIKTALRISEADIELTSNALSPFCQCPGGCKVLTYGVFSTGFPAGQNYKDNALCYWILAPIKASAVTMTFLSFDTEPNYDFVRAYTCFDSACSNRSLLGEWSGSGPSTESVFTSMTGIMYLVFESDATNTGRGFQSAFWGLESSGMYPPNPPQLFSKAGNVKARGDQIIVCDFPVWDASALWGMPFIDLANLTVEEYVQNGFQPLPLDNGADLLLEIVEVDRAPQFYGSSISVPKCNDNCTYNFYNWSTNIVAGMDALGNVVYTERNQILSFSMIFATEFGANMFVNTPLLTFNTKTQSTAALSFQIRPDLQGLASFTVELRDNGLQSSYGGSNFLQKSFEMLIYPPLENQNQFSLYIIPFDVFENSGKQVIGGLLQEIVGINMVDMILSATADEIVLQIGQVLLNVSLFLDPEDRAYFEQIPSFVQMGQDSGPYLSDFSLDFKTTMFAYGRTNITLALQIISSNFSNLKMPINNVPGVDIASRTIIIALNIIPVNQPPSFSLLNNSIVADARYSFFFEQLFAYKILPGPNVSMAVGPHGEDWAESKQSVTFFIQGESPIFLQQPNVNASGYILFQVQEYRSGFAEFQISLKDDGTGYTTEFIVAEGEQSPTVGFQIEINDVNDPPFFMSSCNPQVLRAAGGVSQFQNCSQCTVDNSSCTIMVTVLENCANCDSFGTAPCQGYFMLQSFVTGMTPSVHHSPDEQGQSLSFEVSFIQGVPTLFAPHFGPAIDASSGSLTFCVDTSESGEALYNVSLQDNGGVLWGGSDIYGPIMLKITILPINEQPRFEMCSRNYFGECENNLSCSDEQCHSEVFVWANSSKNVQENFLYNISHGSPNRYEGDSEPFQTATFFVSLNSSVLFFQNPEISQNGTLTFGLNSSLTEGSTHVQILMEDNGFSFDMDAGTPLYCALNGIPYPGVNRTSKEMNFHEIDSYLILILDVEKTYFTNVTLQLSLRLMLGDALKISSSRIHVEEANAESQVIKVMVLGFSLAENIQLKNRALALNTSTSSVPALLSIPSGLPYIKNLGKVAGFGLSQTLVKIFGLSTVHNTPYTDFGFVVNVSSGQDWRMGDLTEELISFQVKPIQYRTTTNPFAFMSRQTLAWNVDGTDGGLLVGGAPAIRTICLPRCSGDEVGNLTASLRTEALFELYGEVLFEVIMAQTTIAMNFSMLVFIVPVNRPPVFRINTTCGRSVSVNESIVEANNSTNETIQIISVMINENCLGCPTSGDPRSCGSSHLYSLSNFIVQNSTFPMNPDLYSFDPYQSGFVNETMQTMTFVAQNLSDEGLFVSPKDYPFINVSSGSLTFCLRHDAAGEASFSVSLRDNGNATNGGVDQSPPFLLRIVVLPVNQAPSFALVPVGNVSDLCNNLSITSPRYCTGQEFLVWAKSGSQTIYPFAIQISRTDLVATDSTEAWQQLTFHVLYNNKVIQKCRICLHV